LLSSVLLVLRKRWRETSYHRQRCSITESGGETRRRVRKGGIQGEIGAEGVCRGQEGGRDTHLVAELETGNYCCSITRKKEEADVDEGIQEEREGQEGKSPSSMEE
jgi:hypothetical protein